MGEQRGTLNIWSMSVSMCTHNTHTHSLQCVMCTQAICASGCKLFAGRVSDVVAQCLTYGFVHSQCLLNDLVEGRDSTICKTGEEASMCINKVYFHTKVKPEPQGMSLVYRTLWKSGMSYKFPPLGIGGSIKSGSFTKARLLRCLFY